jgi:manganese/zinc/iron transport system permease protein
MSNFFTLDFVPLLTAVFAALSCALLGNFLVLRRLSLMGDAISHTVLPGIVFSFLVFDTRGGPLLLLGAMMAAIITTVLVETTKKLANLETGAAMGVVFSSLFALGVLMMEQASARSVDLDAECLLYGQLEGLLWMPPVEATGIKALLYIPVELYTVFGVFAVSVGFVVLFYKELRLASFDPEMSTSLGYNATLLHYLQMIVTAAAVVASFEAVGSILVIGMLICPAATARLLTDSLRVQLLSSLLVALTTTVIGYFLATQAPYWIGLDVSLNASGVMLVTAGLFFTIVAIFGPRYGVLAQRIVQRKLSTTIILEDILGILFRAQEQSEDSSSSSQTRPALARQKETPTLEDIRIRLPHPCNDRQLSKAIDMGYREGLLAKVALPLIELTAAGKDKALNLVRSHRLWENYLLEHTDLDSHQVHKPAESLEHITSPELQEELVAQNTNRQDPHGNKIP